MKKNRETLALRFGFIQPNISGLEGRILTIIEASIQDNTQCEAIKSLVREKFGTTLDWFERVAHTDLSQKDKLYGGNGRPFPQGTVEIK